MNRWSSIVLVALLALAAVSCTRDPQKLKVQYVASGDKLVAQKNYAEAIIQYRNAVAADPRFGEARFKLAGAYAETGDVNNALREYIRAADLLTNDVEAQLRAGNGLLAAGQYPDAKARALAALARDPKNVTGLMLLGNSLAGMKDLDGAITEAQDAVDADPRRTMAYANLGALELAKGNRQSAESAFKRAVEIDPQSADAHLGLANFYWATNQRDEAKSELETALQKNPKSTVANHALAVFYALLNRPTETEKYLKAYANLSPDAGPTLTLADFYVVRNRTSDATAVLQPLLNTKDGFIPAKLRLAALDFVGGRHQEAYRALDEILKREPKNEEALLEKGRFLITEGKPGETLAITNEVVAANPNSASGHYLRGTALKATGSMDDAVKEFQEVLRLSPAATVAELQLADLDMARGDTAAAVEFATHAIKSQPQSLIAHILSARAQLRLGNVTRAEPEVMALAKVGAGLVEVQLLVGDFYWAKKDAAHAIEAYEAALKLEPGRVAALAGLVRIDLVEKKPDAAQVVLAAQLAKTPDNEPVLLLAGETFSKVGNAKQAESTFRHVLQIDPSNIEAYGQLAGIYGAQNRLDEARKEFEELSRRQPQTAVAAATMVGSILTFQNKPDEARKQYEHALALDPHTPVAANNLAWDYAESGTNLDVALELAQTAKSKLPNSAEVSDTLGWVYYKKGLAGLAIASLEEATKEAPSNPSIRYRLGLAYLKNGNQKGARSSFQQALKLDPQFREAEDAKRELAAIKG